MAALTGYRNTLKMKDTAALDLLFVPIADNVKIFVGGMVSLDVNGRAVPAGSAGSVPGGPVIGRAEVPYQPQAIGVNAQPNAVYDNTVVGHSAGALNVVVRAGVFKFANGGGGDAIAQANVDQDCYAIDDQTLGLTDNAGARSRAGKVVQVDTDGIWVSISPQFASPQLRPIDHQRVAAGTILGELIVARGSWANPGAGAQDVQLFAAAGMPLKARVIDSWIALSNAGAGGANTATLRDTAAGAGTALSSAMPTAATGKARDALTATAVAATANGLFLRLTDGTSTGEVFALLRPET